MASLARRRGAGASADSGPGRRLAAGRAGRDGRDRRSKRRRQDIDAARAGGNHPVAAGLRRVRRPGGDADRARGGLRARVHGAREHPRERGAARHEPRRDGGADRRDHRVLGARPLHRCPDQDVLLRDAGPAGILYRRPPAGRHPADRRGARRRGRGVPAQVPTAHPAPGSSGGRPFCWYRTRP